MNEYEIATAQPAVIGSECVDLPNVPLAPRVPSLEAVDVIAVVTSELKNAFTINRVAPRETAATAKVANEKEILNPVVAQLIDGGYNERVSPDTDRILSMLRKSSVAGKSLFSNTSSASLKACGTTDTTPPPGIDKPVAAFVQPIPPHILMQPQRSTTLHQQHHLQPNYSPFQTPSTPNHYNNHYNRSQSIPTNLGISTSFNDHHNVEYKTKLPTSALFNSAIVGGNSSNEFITSGIAAGGSRNTKMRMQNNNGYHQNFTPLKSHYESITTPIRIGGPANSYNNQYNQNIKAFTTTNAPKSSGFTFGSLNSAGTPTGDPRKAFRQNRSLPSENTSPTSKRNGTDQLDSLYDINASTNLLRLIQSNKSPKKIPFIPHNAYSVDPITDSLVQPVARDLIPPGLPINRVPAGMWTCIQQSSKLNPNEDEESFGLSGFDRVLYTRSERARRSSCDEYKAVCRDRAFDLKITMPIQVPNGTCVVDVNSGEHYYGLVESKDGESNISDHILFGRGLRDSKTQSYRDNFVETDQDIPDYTASVQSSACDMWASFLRLKLGVIYNVRQDQLRIVSETLKQIMTGANYDEPIEFQANGIYGNKEFRGILQAPELLAKGVTYMTHLRPKTKQDRDKFISIRQRIKQFANALGFHFGGSLSGVLQSNVSTEYHPLMCVELERNLSSERINNGLIQCEIRSYEKSLASSLKSQIWSPLKDVGGPKMADGNQIYQNITRDKVTTTVESTEIRLEHDHGYCVDPRWPRDLIIARSIASADPGSLFNEAQSADRYARHCFAKSSKPQNIVYRGKFKDMDPGETADTIVKSEACESLPGAIVKKRLCQYSRFNREFTNYLRTEPQAGTGVQVNDPMCPVNAPFPKPHYGPSTHAPPMVNPYIRDVVSTPFHNLMNGGRIATTRGAIRPIDNNDRSWNVNATEFSPSPKSANRGRKAPFRKYTNTSKRITGGHGSLVGFNPRPDGAFTGLNAHKSIELQHESKDIPVPEATTTTATTSTAAATTSGVL